MAARRTALPLENERSDGLREEERENAETFGERHTDDGLDEDLAGGGGIATDGFRGFLADKTDADSGAEQTEGRADITADGNFCEECVHDGGGFGLVAFPPCA